ncbi:uncharacterized protein LOC108670105 [Hyalella azteca]|uniref:Uncharacterized protein LOC108670105 n=1 Tax=Hyalella azteca TaxID=294128 RepID=A0A8B7NHD8_HYAAZ|nr:uncharacterized protein LOC108670105 [Hyalella azteca]
MRRMPIAEPRLTAAAAEGWLVPRHVIAGSNSCRPRSANVKTFIKHQQYCFKESPLILLDPHRALAGPAAVCRHSQHYSTFISSTHLIYNQPSNAQFRHLHIPSRLDRYFDFGLGSREGQDKERQSGLPSKRPSTPQKHSNTAPQAPESGLDADTLRSVALAKELLRASPAAGACRPAGEAGPEFTPAREGSPHPLTGQEDEIPSTSHDYANHHQRKSQTRIVSANAPSDSNYWNSPKLNTTQKFASLKASLSSHEVDPFIRCSTDDNSSHQSGNIKHTQFQEDNFRSLEQSGQQDGDSNADEFSKPTSQDLEKILTQILDVSPGKSSSSSPSRAESQDNVAEDTTQDLSLIQRKTLNDSEDHTICSAIHHNYPADISELSSTYSDPRSTSLLPSLGQDSSTVSSPPGAPHEDVVTYVRSAPCTPEQMMSLLQEDVRSPQDARVLKVAVLGLPNSGKSSIINSLTNNAVCSVSRKVHTTRSLARAAITVGRTQLVFFDTPGTVTPDAARRHKLPSSLVRDAEEAVAQADALLLVVDGACRYTKLGLHPRLLRLLALHPTMPALLCITKVDRVKQRTSLLDVARQLTADTVSGRTSHAPQQPKPHDPYNVPNKTRQELVSDLLDRIQRREQNNRLTSQPRRLEIDSGITQVQESDDRTSGLPAKHDLQTNEGNKIIQSELDGRQHGSGYGSLSAVENQETFKSAEDILLDPGNEVAPVRVTQDISVSEESIKSVSEYLDPNANISLVPASAAVEREFCVSYEELEASNYMYVAPDEASLLEAYRPAQAFSEQDVFQGRVRLSEDQARDFVRDRRGWPLFQEVVFTSVKTGKGVDVLRELLTRRARPATWEYPPAMVTDQDPHQLALATVRAQFLDRLKFQLPYELRFSIDSWELSESEVLQVGLRVSCRQDRTVRLLVGAGGCHIITTAKSAEDQLVKIFKTDVRLRLRVVSDESERRAADHAAEAKLVASGASAEEAQLVVKGVPWERVKQKARILKNRGAVFDHAAGGLVIKRNSN